MSNVFYKCDVCFYKDDKDVCRACESFSNFHYVSPKGHPDPVGAPGENGVDGIPREVIEKFCDVALETPIPAKDVRKILDSGNRRQFESGAVRDIQEGKGRCDLLPLDVVEEFTKGSIFGHIHSFQSTGDVEYLYHAWDAFAEERWSNNPTMFLEVAIHFEEGAKKYGDNNWRKGIPVRCYIDSGVRHYLKFLRGDKDEPHDRAFCWNMMCAIWTCKHHPELNDYKTGFTSDDAEKFWGEADTNG